MNYALINEKYEVLEIKESPITTTNKSLLVVKNIGQFLEGDEVNFYIVVNGIDENNQCTSYSAVKQTPFIQSILSENKELKKQVDSLNIAMANIMGV